MIKRGYGRDALAIYKSAVKTVVIVDNKISVHLAHLRMTTRDHNGRRLEDDLARRIASKPNAIAFQIYGRTAVFRNKDEPRIARSRTRRVWRGRGLRR